jgi:hypothetical protein
MSCIPKILDLKGDKEILPIGLNGVVVEGGGQYKGYDYLITFNNYGFRCGYVAIPNGHPINNYDGKYPDFDVHWGITFFGENHISEVIFGEKVCNDKWLGFDCGHAGDFLDNETAKKYFSDNEKVLKGIEFTIKILKEFEEKMELVNPGYKEYINSDDNKLRYEIRTKEYVEEQCKNLIEQLINLTT